MKLIFVITIILSVLVRESFQYGESNSDGNPLWPERENHAWLNAMRMAPSQYVSVYYPTYVNTTFLNANRYPAVNPVYWSDLIMRTAKAHTVDMVTNDCFQHEDCNGTTWPNRMDKWLGGCSPSAEGENIAAGISPGYFANLYLACENFNPPCKPDGTADGHRSNIMSSSYKYAGVGYVFDASTTYSNYWTQDFMASGCDQSLGPIYGGSHSFWTGNGLIYIANWKFATAISSATVYVVATGSTTVNSYTLTLKLGTATAGSYLYTDANGLSTADCANRYVFVFVSGGTTYRYPSSGSLNTVKSTTSQCASWTSTEISIPSGTTTTGTTSSPTTSTTGTTTTKPTTTTTANPTTTSTTGTTRAPTTTGTTSSPTTTTGTTTTKPMTTTANPATTSTTGTTRAPTTTGTTSSTTTTTGTTTTKPTTTTTKPTTTTTTSSSITTASSTTDVSSTNSTGTTGLDEDPSLSSSNKLIIQTSCILLFIALSLL